MTWKTGQVGTVSAWLFAVWFPSTRSGAMWKDEVGRAPCPALLRHSSCWYLANSELSCTAVVQGRKEGKLSSALSSRPSCSAAKRVVEQRGCVGRMAGTKPRETKSSTGLGYLSFKRSNPKYSWRPATGHLLQGTAVWRAASDCLSTPGSEPEKSQEVFSNNFLPRAATLCSNSNNSFFFLLFSFFLNWILLSNDKGAVSLTLMDCSLLWIRASPGKTKRNLHYVSEPHTVTRSTVSLHISMRSTSAVPMISNYFKSLCY